MRLVLSFFILVSAPILANANESAIEHYLRLAQPLLTNRPHSQICDLDNPTSSAPCPESLMEAAVESKDVSYASQWLGIFGEEDIWQTCNAVHNPDGILASPEELDGYFSQDPDLGLEKSLIEAYPRCFESKDEEFKKAIVAEYYHSGARLRNQFDNSIDAIASIDALLSPNKILHSVGQCDTGLESNKERCESYRKKCKGFSQQAAELKIDGMIKNSMTAIETLKPLQKRLDKLNDGFLWTTKEYPKGDPRREEVKLLRQQIATAKQLVPWIDGESFQDHMEKYDEAKSENQKKSLIEKAIKSQLAANRKELLETANETQSALGCIFKPNQRCDTDDFAETSTNASSLHDVNTEMVDVFSELSAEDRALLSQEQERPAYEVLTANNYLRANQCMKDLNKTDDELAETVYMGAATVALSLTPMGAAGLVAAVARSSRVIQKFATSYDAANAARKGASFLTGVNRASVAAEVGTAAFIDIPMVIESCNDRYGISGGALTKIPKGQIQCPNTAPLEDIRTHDNLTSCLLGAVMGVAAVGLPAGSIALSRRQAHRTQQQAQDLEANPPPKPDLRTEEEITQDAVITMSGRLAAENLDDVANQAARLTDSEVDELIEEFVPNATPEQAKAIIELRQKTTGNPSRDVDIAYRKLKELDMDDEQIRRVIRLGLTNGDSLRPGRIASNDPMQIVVGDRQFSRNENVQFVSGSNTFQGRVVGTGRINNTVLVERSVPGGRTQTLSVPVTRTRTTPEIKASGYADDSGLGGRPYPLERGEFIANGRVYRAGQRVTVMSRGDNTPRQAIVHGSSNVNSRKPHVQVEVLNTGPRPYTNRPQLVTVNTTSLRPRIRTGDQVQFKSKSSGKTYQATVVDYNVRNQSLKVARAGKNRNGQLSGYDVIEDITIDEAGYVRPTRNLTVTRDLSEKQRSLIYTNGFIQRNGFYDLEQARYFVTSLENTDLRAAMIRDLAPDLTEDQVQAVLRAHELPGPGSGLYTDGQIRARLSVMDDAAIPREYARSFIDLGLAGRPGLTPGRMPDEVLGDTLLLSGDRTLIRNTFVNVVRADGSQSRVLVAGRGSAPDSVRVRYRNEVTGHIETEDVAAHQLRLALTENDNIVVSVRGRSTNGRVVSIDEETGQAIVSVSGRQHSLPVNSLRRPVSEENLLPFRPLELPRPNVQFVYNGRIIEIKSVRYHMPSPTGAGEVPIRILSKPDAQGNVKVKYTITRRAGVPAKTHETQVNMNQIHRDYEVGEDFAYVNLNSSQGAYGKVVGLDESQGIITVRYYDLSRRRFVDANRLIQDVERLPDNFNARYGRRATMFSHTGPAKPKPDSTGIPYVTRSGGTRSYQETRFAEQVLRDQQYIDYRLLNSRDRLVQEFTDSQNIVNAAKQSLSSGAKRSPRFRQTLQRAIEREQARSNDIFTRLSQDLSQSGGSRLQSPNDLASLIQRHRVFVRAADDTAAARQAARRSQTKRVQSRVRKALHKENIRTANEDAAIKVLQKRYSKLNDAERREVILSYFPEWRSSPGTLERVMLAHNSGRSGVGQYTPAEIQKKYKIMLQSKRKLKQQSTVRPDRIAELGPAVKPEEAQFLMEVGLTGKPPKPTSKGTRGSSKKKPNSRQKVAEAYERQMAKKVEEPPAPPKKTVSEAQQKFEERYAQFDYYESLEPGFAHKHKKTINLINRTVDQCIETEACDEDTLGTLRLLMKNDVVVRDIEIAEQVAKNCLPPNQGCVKSLVTHVHDYLSNGRWMDSNRREVFRIALSDCIKNHCDPHTAISMLRRTDELPLTDKKVREMYAREEWDPRASEANIITVEAQNQLFEGILRNYDIDIHTNLESRTSSFRRGQNKNKSVDDLVASENLAPGRSPDYYVEYPNGEGKLFDVQSSANQSRVEGIGEIGAEIILKKSEVIEQTHRVIVDFTDQFKPSSAVQLVREIQKMAEILTAAKSQIRRISVKSSELDRLPKKVFDRINPKPHPDNPYLYLVDVYAEHLDVVTVAIGTRQNPVLIRVYPNYDPNFLKRYYRSIFSEFFTSPSSR
ncbi:MAG: hypothetical protein CL677_07155 [Bdellovibrionaceae bacterium]|nr:hypothetical protein [Pseudobdellovibrionaceae bacterium]|tara:strand:- start:33310 stop:39387 length:6078 start_codon:yes stop_codon:yes gene_type:complete